MSSSRTDTQLRITFAGATTADGSQDIIDQKQQTSLSTSSDDLLCSMTPYLTCQRCNSVMFIELQRVRRKEDQRRQLFKEKEDTTLLYEQVPKCLGCGSTRYLRAGAVSFEEEIEKKRIANKEFERRRGPATALLQRIARGFLGRLDFRRRQLEREQYQQKITRAATIIQKRIRGMHARRRSIIERCLQVIRFMAPQILSYALATRPNEPPVFWYTNTAELRVFYWNYREFVRRSGNRPTLIKVEDNVLEITRRVLRREYVLVSRIQAAWRGITTRMVFSEFKQQKGWLKSIRQSPAIKIQRLVRGEASRRRCRVLRVTNKYPAQREAYRKEMMAREKEAKAAAFRQRLMEKYKQQFQINRTTRMIVQQVKSPSTINSSLSKFSIGSFKEESEDRFDSDVEYVRTANGTSTGLDITKSGPAATSTKPPRNLNAVRFAELKRQREHMHGKLRGPKLHILQAQMYS